MFYRNRINKLRRELDEVKAEIRRLSNRLEELERPFKYKVGDIVRYDLVKSDTLLKGVIIDRSRRFGVKVYKVVSYGENRIDSEIYEHVIKDKINLTPNI